MCIFIHSCANICVYMRCIRSIYDEHVYVSVHICYRCMIYEYRRIGMCTSICDMYMLCVDMRAFCLKMRVSLT